MNATVTSSFWKVCNLQFRNSLPPSLALLMLDKEQSTNYEVRHFVIFFILLKLNFRKPKYSS
jgi:hypothetical protein